MAAYVPGIQTHAPILKFSYCPAHAAHTPLEASFLLFTNYFS
jgi:hypothetical protein